MSEVIPFETLSAELLRAIRGGHAQALLSKRIGYESNIVYRWETKKCWPTAAVFLRLCERVGIDVGASFQKFYGRRPDWLTGRAAEDVPSFLQDLQGTIPIQTLARAVGQNRFTVSRWLTGAAEPRLPDFLRMVEASSRRTLDLVSTWVDPEEIPCVARPWRKLVRARQVAYDAPWSHAVLRALELRAFRNSRTKGVGALAKRLGISETEVTNALHTLQRAGQVRKTKGSWRITKNLTVNTGQDPERSRELKAFWIQVATERLRSKAPGFFGYSLFAISANDLRRLREVQLEYIHQMQAIIADSAPGECVGLYGVQLLDLATSERNAFSAGRKP